MVDPYLFAFEHVPLISLELELFQWLTFGTVVIVKSAILQVQRSSDMFADKNNFDRIG